MIKKLTIREKKDGTREINIYNWDRKNAIHAMSLAIAHIVAQMDNEPTKLPVPTQSKPTGQASLFIQE
jgi:hypothetical protein